MPTSDPTFSIPVVYYQINVEQVLKGDVAGKIEVRIDGASGHSEYDSGESDIEVGNRYLFFTGGSLPDGAYAVTAGLDTIPITNDREEASLIARFERLIPEVERSAARAQAQAQASSERLPTEAPQVSIEPREGRAGTEVVILGENFLPGQILITWDVEGYGEVAMAGENFSFEHRLAVPKDLQPGAHAITVQDGYAPAVEVEFVVSD